MIARVFVLTAVLVACEGDGERVGDGYLRPEVVRVYAGQKANDPSCIKEDASTCPTFENVALNAYRAERTLTALARVPAPPPPKPISNAIRDLTSALNAPKIAGTVPTDQGACRVRSRSGLRPVPAWRASVAQPRARPPP